MNAHHPHRHPQPSPLCPYMPPYARLAILLMLFLMLFATGVGAQSFITGQTHTPLPSRGASGCNATWYNPSVTTLPNGDLGFVAQATRHPGSSCTEASWNLPNIDDLYSARMNATTGAWTLPAPSSCPTLKGRYNRCGFDAGINPGPIGGPSVVKVGATYYMAFNGGNADFITGRVHWATSTDGVNWSVLGGSGNWTPLVKPRHHDCNATLHHAVGVAEVNLVYESGGASSIGGMGATGFFYLYFTHYGYDTNQVLDTWVVRIPRNTSQPGHLAATGKQIWHRTTSTNGTWKTFDSGEMVFTYDVAAGLPAVTGEPVLGPYQGRPTSGHFRFGSGEIIRDQGKWLHVYNFGSTTYSQTSTSLSNNTWTNPTLVNDTSLRSLVTTGDNSPRDIGLHHATIDDRTGLWVFAPMGVNNCSSSNIYVGLEVVPAELCTSANPTISSLSPSSGPSSGGTTVTIYGNNLDCASSVTFGGTQGTILSRTATRITVRTPAHAGGSVNVVVTTPGGSATRTGGFTYTAPPAYGGFHDSINCYGISGWAWDANQPNTPIQVSIYKDGTFLNTILADGFRQDLLNAGIGDGRHGFGYSLPASVRDGNSHSIEVRFGGTNTKLNQSPRTIQCRSLSITKAGTGSGTVTSSPAGVQCGSTCQRYVPQGFVVNLHATPDSGSIFTGWTGAGDCSDGTVSMTANRSCTATFNIDSNADARLIWIQPQAMAGFGPPGSLVMAGSATDAPSGSRVTIRWRNVTTSSSWITNSFLPLPDAQGYWFSSIPNANTSQVYEVEFDYGGITWSACTYPGSGGFFWCP